MTTRRDFMKSAAAATTALAAGIAFTGCSTMNAPAAQSQSTGGGRRRQVAVNGRRVKTVDVHSHCVIPEAMALMGRKIEPSTLVVSQDRTRIMDEQGIDVEALSINPIWYELPRDLVEKVIAVQNEKLAQVAASQPDRFVAMASVAMQFPDLAVQQLETAVKKYGMRAVAVGSRVGPLEFGDQKLHPFWAKVEQLGVLAFIHPAGVPQLNARLKGNGVLENVIGNPLDTTIALSHLIFQGTLDRFPGLKICSAHGGGYLPSYADRSDHGCLTFPERCDKSIVLKKKPTEYLKQLYFDSLIFTPDALKHLARQVGSSQIVLGTDYPFPWEDKAVDHILNTPGFSDEEKIAMLGGTAQRLLGIR